MIDNDGWTTLMHADNADIVKILIAAGANVNAKNNFGQRALMMTAMMGQIDCVKALLAAGADS